MMAEKQFLTLEECCDFAKNLILLSPKEQLNHKDDVVTMHIALDKFIDEFVNGNVVFAK